MPWTRKQRAYQQILADPGEDRDAEQIASELVVSTDTLEEWEGKEGFWSEVNRYARIRAERALAAVWRALTSKACRGEVSAIKLLFNILGQTTGAEASPQQPIEFKLIVENGNGNTILHTNSSQLDGGRGNDLS